MLTSIPVMREREKGRERKRGREGVRDGGRERGRNQSYSSNLNIIIELILLAEDIDREEHILESIYLLK